MDLIKVGINNSRYNLISRMGYYFTPLRQFEVSYVKSRDWSVHRDLVEFN